MGQHEYEVGLGAKPDELKRISLAFRAGEQKERDRIRNLILDMSEKSYGNESLGILVWSKRMIEELKLDESISRVL